VRGVNFFRADDMEFLRALQRGEHHIAGLRNRSLQPHRPGWSAPPKIGRTLRRFRVLKSIKPVSGTRKYYPTPRGESLLIAGLQITERINPPSPRRLEHRRKSVRCLAERYSKGDQRS
jgi:hypothetical protein